MMTLGGISYWKGPVMKMKISREDVWAASLVDRPGSLAEKLEALSKSKVNLQFVIARREASKPGTGVVFVTPIVGAARVRAARKVGFAKTKTLHSLRLECTDQPGLGAKLTKILAEAGINLRGLSAAAIGRRCVVHLAFDRATDAHKATRVLEEMA